MITETCIPHDSCHISLMILTWNISYSMALSSKASNQHFIVLLDEVETAIIRHKSSDLLPILDQLNTNTLSDGRVGLFSLNTSEYSVWGEGEREISTKLLHVASCAAM